MSNLIIANPLAMQASRQMRELTSYASVLGTAASTGQNAPSQITPVNTVLAGIYNNQLATLNGCDGGITNSIAYLQNALASLQEQQALLQSTLQLANQVVTTPGVQAAATLVQLNNQYQTQIQQIQQVVTTSVDASGVQYLNGTIGSFAAGAAGYLNSLGLAANFAKSTTGQGAGGASPSLANVLANTSNAIHGTNAVVTAALAATYNVPANQVANVTAALASATAGIIAAGTQANPPTIGQYLESAMQIIPSIAMNFAQVQQQFNDAIRVERICTLLPQLLVDAGVAAGAGALAVTVATQLAATITQTSIPQNTLGAGANMANAITLNVGAVAPAVSQAGADIAALLTPQEIANIVTLAGTRNSVLDIATGLGQVTAGAITGILSQITSFANIGLTAAGAVIAGGILDTTVVGAAGACVVNTNGGGLPTAIGGNIAYYQGSGGATTGGIFGIVAQAVVEAYPINAATTLINNAATVPMRVQIGLNAASSVPLQINNTNTTALNVANTNVMTLAGAQTAVQNLQNALNFINSTIANIVGQVNQLTARDATVNTQAGNLSEAIDLIEDTDLVANASDLSSLNTAIGVVGALIQLSASIQQTIASAAQQILRG